MKSRSFLLSMSAIGLALGLVTGAGCSDPPPPTPRAAVFAQMGNGDGPMAHTQVECMLGPTNDWVIIGTIGPDRMPNAPVVPIDNGTANSGSANTTFSGHIVSVDCSVTASGGMLSVNAVAQLQGIGAMTVSGTFATAPTDGSTIPPQTGVTGIFQRGDTGQFKETDCTVTFPRPEMGLAPGRIWGQLDCPNAAFPSQSRVCAGSAEVRFENCAQ